MSLPPSIGILIRGWPIAFRNSRRPRKKHAWLTSSVAWSSEMRWVVARSRSESLSRACVGDQVGGGTILAIPNCSTSGRILRKYLNGSDHSCSDGRSVGPSTHLSASSFIPPPWRGRSVRPLGSALASLAPRPRTNPPLFFYPPTTTHALRRGRNSSHASPARSERAQRPVECAAAHSSRRGGSARLTRLTRPRPRRLTPPQDPRPHPLRRPLLRTPNLYVLHKSARSRRTAPYKGDGGRLCTRLQRSRDEIAISTPSMHTTTCCNV